METKEKAKGVGGNGNLIPCKPGETHNPNGRPKGQRNYATIYRAALIKIGQTIGMTPDEVEEEMERAGLLKALQGDFNFQKDIKDRLHGKPEQTTNLKANVTLTLSELYDAAGGH